MNKRTEVLYEADAAVNGSRQKEYGKIEDSFRAIADLWSVYLGKEILPLDVAIMMTLLKVARIQSAPGAPTEDSFVDACGYVACAAEIALREED